MGTRTTTILSLFTGYGGLEHGISRALGGARAVCMVEREAFAIANLVAQMQAGAVAQAPIWTDVSTFDGRPWRDRVDILCGGPPCQPFSTAGKRKHTDDERWIWADVARIIGEVRPGVVFLENVPGLRKRGLGVMLRDLAAMGYDAEWGCFKASDAGAPHRRTRLFLLAYSNREQLRHHQQRATGGRVDLCHSGQAQPQHDGAEVADSGGVGGRKVQQAATTGRPDADVGDEEVADASGLGLSKPRATHDHDGGHAPRHQPDGCHEGMGDTDGSRPPQHVREPGDARQEQPPAIGAGGGVEFPPGPDDTDGWRRWIRAGGPQPGVRGGPYGAPDRVDRVRLLGNGVVPAQAALAFQELSARALA